MSRSGKAMRAAARPAAALVILGFLVWRLGAGPFLDGLRSIDATDLLVAAAIAVPTTVCAAWRWTVVSRGLGDRLGLGEAVSAYYRSQFLNTVLPTGVVGDAHRGVSRGRSSGDLGLGIRAVVWERVAGQVVAVVLIVGLLAALASPARSVLPVAVPVGLVVVALLCVALALAGRGRPWVRRLMATAGADVRTALLARSAWPLIVLASTLVVVGHTATFLVAARTAGASVPVGRVLPLALLVLLAMAIPVNLGGWGPREGVAAWAFGAAGLGAATGVSTAVVYGVITTVAVLPGAVLLAIGGRRRGPNSRRHAADREGASVG